MLTGPGGAGSQPGILLSGHLDSDNLDIPDLKNLRVEGDQLLCPGQVGLDCKTGVAIALSVLQRLQDAPREPESLAKGPSAAGMPRSWQVHVLFTVGEEAGQKGAFRAPLPKLLPGKVRYAIVVDRMTRGSGAPRADGGYVRHAVTEYKGVPLLDGSGAALLEHLAKGKAHATGTTVRPMPEWDVAVYLTPDHG